MVHILAAAIVGSHLDTIFAVEKALRVCQSDIKITIVDLVGFTRWDCVKIPYPGKAARIKFGPSNIVYTNEGFDWLAWRSIKKSAQSLLEEVGPDLLLLVDDSWYGEYALLLAAKQRNCPSLLIQEGPFRQGILPKNNIKFRSLYLGKKYIRTFINLMKGRFPGPQLPNYGSGGATCIAVASEYYAGLFSMAGVSAESIRITGIPRYDKIQETCELKKGFRQKRKLTSTLNILLIHQPFVRYGELSLEQYECVCEITAKGLNDVRQRYNIELTVRFHPSDEKLDLAPLLKRLRGAVELQLPAKPLLEEIYDYDVVVGFYSSVLLEALAVEIPVVSIDTGREDPRQLWLQKAGVPVVRSPFELVAVCKKIIDGKLKHVNGEILSNEIGVIDGRASKRVADLLLTTFNTI